MISRSATPVRSCLALLTVLLPAGCSQETPAEPVPQREAPAWLEPFPTVAEQWRFQSTLVSWFNDRGIAVRLDERNRLVEVGGKRRVFDVAEVARACATLPERQWREALDAQLGALIETSEELATWQPPAWDEARTKLRARIYPDGFVEAAGMSPDDVVHRVDLEGTITGVVFDRGESVLLVPSDAPEAWDLSSDQVITTAIANTWEVLSGEFALSERDLGEFGTLHEVTSDSYYATLAALWLERWPELIGEHGAFVAIPWRHSVLVLPFRDARAARGVPGLYAVARQVVEGGTGAVAPSIWWRRPDGGFAAVPIEEVDGRPVADPPPELRELVRELLDR